MRQEGFEIFDNSRTGEDRLLLRIRGDILQEIISELSGALKPIEQRGKPESMSVYVKYSGIFLSVTPNEKHNEGCVSTASS